MILLFFDKCWIPKQGRSISKTLEGTKNFKGKIVKNLTPLSPLMALQIFLAGTNDFAGSIVLH